MRQVPISTFFIVLILFVGLNFLFIAKIDKTPCKETPKLRRSATIGHNLNVSKIAPKIAPKYGASHYFKHLKNDVTINIDQILWSRNWHHLATCQTVDPSYYKVGTGARQTVETLKKYFLGCSGIIWVRMGSGTTGDVSKFALDVAPLMTKPFSLITTDGDAKIPSEVPAAKQLLENPFLVHWYTQNYDGSLSHPKLKAIPIGFDLHTHRKGLWSKDPGENLKKMLELRSSNYTRSMVPLQPPWSWDHPDRRTAVKAIQCVKHDHPSKMPINDLWHSYKEHYFVLSPFGNGLDCHRTWELLFFGAIPIVKTSSLDRLYVNLPVIIVKKWSEICSEGFFEDQLAKIKGVWPASLEVFHMNHWLLTTTNKEPSLKDCQPTFGITPLDIVIPLLDPMDPALKRTLRSFEKNGLLDIVRHVHIITNDDSVHSELHRQYKGLKVVSLTDVNIPYDLTVVREFAWTTMFAAPFLESIAANYLMTPDDTILNKPIKPEFLFDFNKNMQYVHSFGTSSTGNSISYRNIAPLHGPNLLNTCSMKFIINKYKDTRPAIDPISVTLGEMKSEGLISHFFGYHSHKFRDIAGMDYYSECHTNGGCSRPGFDDLFVNIQGEGISKEYGDNSQLKRTFDTYFEKQFPTASRYEKI